MRKDTTGTSRRFLCGIGALLVFMLGSGGSACAQPAQARNGTDALTAVLAPRPEVRPGQSATQLPDGRWLLMGGQLGARSATPDASVVNIASGIVSRARGKLVQPRSGHTATLMPDGKVLILGGVDAAGEVVALVEQFDPQSGQFAVVPDLGLIARSGHTATVLATNRLFVGGGADQHGRVVYEAEIVDLATRRAERFNLKLDSARVNHVAALLPGSDVLLWGGIGADRKPLAGGEIYKIDSQSLDTLGAAAVAELGKTLGGPEAPGVKATQPVAEDESAAPDQAIVVQFTQRMMMQTLNAATVTLIGPHGAVAVKVTPLEYGLLLFVTPTQDLLPGSRYTLFISDAKSMAGRTLPLVTLGFGTARLDSAIEPEMPSAAPAAMPDDVRPAASTAAQSRQAIDAAEATNDDETWHPNGRHFRGDWRARRGLSALQGLPALRASEGETALAGQVLTLHGRALANVTLSINGQSTTSDDTGRFLLRQLAPGDAVLTIDGSSASRNGRHYGVYQVRVKLDERRTNVLPYTIWSPVLDPGGRTALSSPSAKETIVTSPRIPGLELHIPAGTVIRDRHGKIVRELNMTAIPTDRPPFPIPRVGVPVYFTIQPGGATISNINGVRQQGARLIYPNFSGAAPGTRIDFWNYDTQRKGWYIYGKGAVSKDGKQVLPDAGVAIYELTGAMISLPSGAPAEGPPLGGCGAGGAGTDECSADKNQPSSPSGCAGDPVDCATGLFLHAANDLFIKDVLPIGVSRSYRPRDPASRAFGRGTNLSYDVFLIGDTDPWTYQELVLPDGGRIHFDRISPGTRWSDAVYAHTSSATKYAGSILQYKGSVTCFWELTLKSGATMCFPDSEAASNPRIAAATSMSDRHGNTVTITRDAAGNATKVSAPSGRYIQFGYDGGNRITSATDSAGRTLSYEYDGDGRLIKATDPLGKFESYTYDDNHNMLTVRDKRGNLMVTNEYDEHARVSKQTYADGTTNLFSYTLDADNKVTRTEVTDERGIVKRMDFNASGNVTKITSALGLPEQQAVSFERDPGSGLLLSQTDAMGRKTEFGYDAKGNMTSQTSMAGTPEAATVTKSYTADFNQLASVTDALGRKSTVTYDTLGNAIEEKDANGDTIVRAFNAAGQVTRLTDGLDKSIVLEYAGTDLVGVTDPLGRSVAYFIDALGRVGRVTDALGNKTIFEFDAADKTTQIRDASLHPTSVGFDASGNPTSVTDSNGGRYRFAFDKRHVATASTDPMERSEVIEYDGRNKPVKRTDRKGQVTTYLYDALERIVKTTFADNSTIDVSYDAANRPTQIVDSANGTIAIQYNNRDELTQAVTPKGRVDYTYYLNGLRRTMTVFGQPTLTYTYDNGNRLARIDQAAGAANNQVAQSLAFAYDKAGRRTRTTYLNGLTRNDAYDDAGNLTGIVFRNADASVLGDLAYTYDLAGRRTSVGGSLARTNMPAVLANVNVDSSNRLLAAGAASLTYDANGNLTDDGVYTYVWNARDQLVRIEMAAGGVVASFTYDALGRRQTKTAEGVGTGYVYDGANIVQEMDGALVRANYISGRTDEVFAQLSGTGAGANVLTYLSDAQGSTIRLVDAAGAKVADYSYDPYGDTTADATVSNPFQYTGRENDGTGLYYYRARYYSPRLARFISSDPIGLGGGINPYAYVRGNPVKYVDPWGLAPGDPYRTQHDAARAATRQFNMSSIMDNLEYGGMIYRNPNGSYSYTKPNIGEKDEVNPGGPEACHPKTVPTAYYHTHAAYDPQYANEQFSPEDLLYAEEHGLDAYVATPNSNLKYLDHVTHQISSIGSTGFWP